MEGQSRYNFFQVVKTSAEHITLSKYLFRIIYLMKYQITGEQNRKIYFLQHNHTLLEGDEHFFPFIIVPGGLQASSL